MLKETGRMRYANERFMDLDAHPFLPAENREPRLQQNEWQPIKARIHEASGGICHYCGEHAGPCPICDHLIPLSRGGTNAPSNLVTACDACNAAKGALTPSEWAKKRSAA